MPKCPLRFRTRSEAFWRLRQDHRRITGLGLPDRLCGPAHRHRQRAAGSLSRSLARLTAHNQAERHGDGGHRALGEEAGAGYGRSGSVPVNIPAGTRREARRRDRRSGGFDSPYCTHQKGGGWDVPHR